MTKQIEDYYSDWQGWFCEVPDEWGGQCGEVIGCDIKELRRHLKEEHNIEVKLND